MCEGDLGLDQAFDMELVIGRFEVAFVCRNWCVIVIDIMQLTTKSECRD